MCTDCSPKFCLYADLPRDLEKTHSEASSWEAHKPEGWKVTCLGFPQLIRSGETPGRAERRQEVEREGKMVEKLQKSLSACDDRHLGKGAEEAWLAGHTSHNLPLQGGEGDTVLQPPSQPSCEVTLRVLTVSQWFTTPTTAQFWREYAPSASWTFCRGTSGPQVAERQQRASYKFLQWISLLDRAQSKLKQ